MLLETKDLGKTYTVGKLGVRALSDINLSIGEGEFTALCGPSGSGKTTLLNLIGCIDKADKGEILLEGRSLTGKSPDEYALLRREYFGFIFQTYNLVPVLTVRENVEIPLRLIGHFKPKEIEERVMETLIKVGLGDLSNRKPLELSGGQQQRVSIARALVKSPKLILADEPTANLDSVNGESVVRLMEDMNRDLRATFIFSTHDPLIMKHAKRIVRLHDGRIESDGK